LRVVGTLARPFRDGVLEFSLGWTAIGWTR
jgi:hypothetical protein